MMQLYGHFEKGAWVPGPMDAIDGIRDGIISLGVALAPEFDKIRESIIALGDVEIFGRFVQGRWVAVTIRDLHIEEIK